VQLVYKYQDISCKMAAEKRPRKPVVREKKQILKITRGVREIYIRAKYLNTFEHVYTPLIDTIDYIVTPSVLYSFIEEFGKLHGIVPLIFLTTEFGVSTDVLREHIESMWKDVADSVAGKVVNASELDKAVPDEAKEFEVFDISESYMEPIRKLLRGIIRGR